jgi:hypothetical protein
MKLLRSSWDLGINYRYSNMYSIRYDIHGTGRQRRWIGLFS